MLISSTEFKSNIGRYLTLVSKEDIIITRNGKRIARLTEEKDDRIAIARSLLGALPNTISSHEAKEEKQKRYESID